MTTATREIASGSTLNCDPRAVRRGVWRIRMDERRQLGWFAGRAQRRIPIRRAILVTPVIMEGGTLWQPTPVPATVVAYTTDVSVKGIGFAHDEPLPTRHAIVTFDREDEEPVSLVVAIEWFDQQEGDWFRSGGRFIAATGTPDFLCYPRETDPQHAVQQRQLISHGIKRPEVPDGRRNSRKTHWSRSRTRRHRRT